MASTLLASGAEAQVLVAEKRFSRILTLNRPRQLNALSYEMVSKLLDLFTSYEEDPAVQLVILKGSGSAFCAGGDLRAVVRMSTEGSWRLSAQYFWKEFVLDYIISTYRKLQVSILDGLLMGGGVGLSIHGKFRVATENSVFSMPETLIGLFPDVGASYFLSRLPGFFGEFCGLTGARLDGADMLACGLATHFVPAVKLPMLEEALSNVDICDSAVISAVIDQFSEQAVMKDNSAYHRMESIGKCFSKRTTEEIILALEEEANLGDEWATAVLQSLKKASPTSLKLSLRSIRQGRMQTIDECLVREYRMVCHILRKDVSGDLYEGCRAILLEKDKNPKWEPSNLDMVSEEMIERFFLKVDDEDWEDLKLPSRLTSFAASSRSKL